MRRYLLLLILLPACAALSGQTLSYAHYDTKDGLAGSVVYCAAEDRDGFLWFGTETGLSRFDGTHFHTYTTADGLPDNEILKLFVDSKNRVWIIPFRNAVCYFSRGRFYTSDNDPALRSLSISADINTIQEDKYGNVIMAERSVIHIISPGQITKNISWVNDTPVSLPAGSGLNSDSVLTFYTITPGGSFKQFAMRGQHFLCEGQRKMYDNTVNTTLYSPAVNVFLEHKSFAFYSECKKIFSLRMPENFISISKIDNSLFTLNTTEGALLYDIKQKKEIAHFLEDQSVNAVTRDSEGNFWLMSAGNGVFRVGSLTSRNPVFREKNETLSVTCIQKIGGSFYIGTEHGTIWKTDSLLQQFRKKKLSGYPHNLGRVMAIVPAGKNSLLLGTDGGPFLLHDFTQSLRLQHLAVKSIMAYNDTFLISTTARSFLLHGPGMKEDEIWPGRATCAWKKDSVFFIGTIAGLYTLTGNKKTFLGDSYPVFKNRVVDIRAAPDGTLWIATCGQGIAGYKNNRLVCTLTEEDGLTSNICRTIFIAGPEVWLGTDKGLNRICRDGAGFHVTKFSDVDGLSSGIINTVYVDNTNVYVGSANGLTSFNTGKIKVKSSCNLRVTAIRATGHVWNYDTSGLVLPHRQNSIQVEFAGISFRSAGDITYRYRLKGLSDTWQTTRATYLSYPTLPSGKYELQLEATNKFGVQSNLLLVSFTVEKLLWEKTGFIILAAAILGSLFWLFVTLRIRALRAQNEEKIMTANRINELEQMALKAQMNPHFIFNSLNSIQKYVIEKDIRGANKFITDFSRLIRLTLEISTQAKISIDDEIKYITTYLELEKTRFGHVFNYTIQPGPAVNRLSWHIPPMVLQPYIENSIRHGVRYREDNEGIISVCFIKKEPHLVCIIEDNGIGRKRARHFKSLEPIEYQSRGMALTARRMEMINKTQASAIITEIEDLGSDTAPAGTRVTIYFPLQNVINSNV